MSDTASEVDEQFMRRAIALAMKGRGAVEPNPMVGCVIVKGDRVIGEGYHQKFGGPHAEPNALAACTEPPAGATVYVSLEPCCHTNKKTPPCVPRLVEAKVSRVIVGCLDPNRQVRGKGVEELRQAGIEVPDPALEAEAKQLNAAFFKRALQRLPYVTLKWAQSSNGKVAGPKGQQVWISNNASTRLVHELRSRCDAILVAINTVLADDPLLTARGVESPRPLLRAVLDTHLRLPLSSRLIKTAGEHPLVVYCASAEAESVAAGQLRDCRVRVVGLKEEAGRLALDGMLADLRPAGMTHLLVEPGPTLAHSFLHQNLADRVWVFRSPNSIEGPSAPAAPAVSYPATATIALDKDELTEYLNPTSPAFFSLQASADLPHS